VNTGDLISKLVPDRNEGELDQKKTSYLTKLDVIVTACISALSARQEFHRRDRHDRRAAVLLFGTLHELVDSVIAASAANSSPGASAAAATELIEAHVDGCVIRARWVREIRERKETGEEFRLGMACNFPRNLA
jgi:hypothetical protein